MKILARTDVYDMKPMRLTKFEATMLVAGAGLGTGILTLPYAISKIGVFGALAAALFACASSLIIYSREQ